MVNQNGSQWSAYLHLGPTVPFNSILNLFSICHVILRTNQPTNKKRTWLLGGGDKAVCCCFQILRQGKVVPVYVLNKCSLKVPNISTLLSRTHTSDTPLTARGATAWTLPSLFCTTPADALQFSPETPCRCTDMCRTHRTSICVLQSAESERSGPNVGETQPADN